MVKTLFFRMAVLSMLGLGTFQSGAFAQDGVARTSSPINVISTAPNVVGGSTGQYYIMSERPNAYRPPNPSYWTQLPCPLGSHDACHDPCSDGHRGTWTTPFVRWVLDPNYYAVAPDHGWAPPGKWPIVRTSPVYQKYVPDQWYGNGHSASGMQQVSQQGSPMIGQQTDTAQSGYYYKHVPTWQPNPRMLPAAPHPRTWHYRPGAVGPDGSYSTWVPLRNAWVPVSQIPSYGGMGVQITPLPVEQAPVNAKPQPESPEAVPVPPPVQQPGNVPVPPPVPEASNEDEVGADIRKASFIQRAFGRR